MSDDPFLQYDGMTLRNRLGIKNNPEALSSAERNLSSIREQTVNEEVTGNFDADHLRAIHKHLLQDVYEWAGTMRNDKITLEGEQIDVASRLTTFRKEDSYFATPRLIDQGLDEISERAAASDARSPDRETFANAASEILGALNKVHPFREGNGRTQRVFMEQLAIRAGHELDFSGVTGERMISASIEAHKGSNQSLKDILSESLDPDRVELRIDAVEAFQRINFEINERHLETAKEGQHVRGVLIGQVSKHASIRTEDSRIVVVPRDAIPRSMTPHTPVDLVFSNSHEALREEARELAARDNPSAEEQRRIIEIMEKTLSKPDLNELRIGESKVLKDFGTRDDQLNIAEKFLAAEQSAGAERTDALEAVGHDRNLLAMDQQKARDQDYAEQDRKQRDRDRDEGWEL